MAQDFAFGPVPRHALFLCTNSPTVTLSVVPQSPIRSLAEYLPVRCFVFLVGLMPRRLARRLCAALGLLLFRLHSRLRRVGLRNLAMALPELGSGEHQRILRQLFVHIGWHFAEFCRMSRYTRENAAGWIRCAGMEHYEQAKARGNGVLVLTGHLGAWELSSFYHSLQGHPMGLVARPLDNPRLDAFVRSIRCRHGNWIIPRNDFARGLLQAMHQGRSVGILMDTNMTPPEGIFVPFFGIPACTASGLARIALRTGAAIVPGFLLWEQAESRYVLHFAPPIHPVVTDNRTQDIAMLTAQCTAVLESWIRRYPDQWLWIHRRWKTRPVGDPPLYGNPAGGNPAGGNHAGLPAERHAQQQHEEPSRAQE